MRNFQENPETFGFDGEYPAENIKAQFWHFSVKNCKISTVKHSMEKPIFFNFVNLFTFCPRFFEETDFYF